MNHAVITANRLRDGVAVWRDAAGGWVEPFAQAAAFTPDDADAALAQAQTDIARQIVVGVYKAEVTVRDGDVTPQSVRETIRARGPSVRPDLGIQASADGAP